MVFAFRSQPLKTVYILYFVALLVLRLPSWVVLSAIPSMRPRRSYSFLRAILVRLLRAVIEMQYNIGFIAFFNAKEQSTDNPAFVWVKPAPDDLIVGNIATAAQTNNVGSVNVPGYWYGQSDSFGGYGQRAAPGERVIYWLHGGGYITGTSDPRGFLAPIVTGILSNSGDSFKRAFGLDYRLSSAAPYVSANPFPAAILDAVAGYRYLVHDLGFEPENIVVEGDSAGGHLGVTLVLYLIHSQFKTLRPPGGLLLLSPAGDWAGTHDHDPSCSMRRNYHADFVHYVFQSGYSAKALLGSLPATELASNIYISPSSLTLQCRQGTFCGFPPTCIIAGGAEVMLDQIRAIRDRLRADNDSNKITYHEYPDAIHDLLLFTMFEPQRSSALKDIEQWVISLNRSFSSPILCFAGGVAGSAYAAIRRQPVRTFAISAGLNATLVGLVFFSVREVIVSPGLVSMIPSQQYLRRREALQFGNEAKGVTWGEMRSYKLLDSSLAGAGTASLASVIRGGGNASPIPAAFAGALLCVFIQYFSNEVSVSRVKFVSSSVRRQELRSGEPDVPMFERIKDALGNLVPIQRGPDSDSRELDKLKRQREESERKLSEVNDKLKEFNEKIH